MTRLNDESGQNLVAEPGAVQRPRVLSGMRPTGRLHLGNYMGALYNWVKLQHEYECYFFIADYHALTTDYADPSRLQEHIRDVALDFLAAGLDPDLCTIFVQSDVTEHFELQALLSMITPLSWLERVPSYKDQQEQLREKDLATYGFLGYPLLQSADILLYRPKFVPVGQDQAAHVEITREIARRFTFFYPRSGRSQHDRLKDHRDPKLTYARWESDEILPEPQVLLTPSPKLPGTDGRKMSKSYRNTILLSDEPETVRKKMESMSNGGQRARQSDPGDPNVCPVGDLHRVFSSAERVSLISGSCRTATIGCLECKRMASDSILKTTEPIYRKRIELESDKDFINSVLNAGAERASRTARRTMAEVRKVMGVARTSAPNMEHSMTRAIYSAGIPMVHNLESRKDLWTAEEPTVRDSALRHYWIENMVPREAMLKQDSPHVFITASGKRVYVGISIEDVLDTWRFSSKPKSYEVLGLICWDRNYILHDFIVPQIAYHLPWIAYKKAHKNDTLFFTLKLSNGRFYLELPGADPIDVTEFSGRYGAMS